MITISSPAPATYTLTPPDHALAAWTFDVTIASTFAVPSVAGRLEFVRIRLPQPASITNIHMAAVTVGATLTAGQNFAALYTAAGALIAQSADQSTAWTSGGVKNMTLAGGPHSLNSGDYYIGFWHNGTTAPGWAISANTSSTLVNIGRSSPNLRIGNANTGLTTTAPATMGAQTVAAASWWAGLS